MTAVVLLAGVPVVPPAAAAAAGITLPPLPQQRSVPATAVPVAPRGADPEAGSASPPAGSPRWPRAHTGTLVLPAAATGPAAGRPHAVPAGDSPVSVARAVGPGSATAVEVAVADRSSTVRAGVDGLLLAVRPTGTRAAGRVRVGVDYRGFRQAYGGDWASRLRLVALPDCVLAEPDPVRCSRRQPAAGTNDTRTHRASAVVTAAAGGSVYALTADESGPAGDHGATPLAASATWDAGGPSGDFSWSYPMRVPPSLGGPAPELELAYSSGSVDGRTAATNNQASWAGEGFDLGSGFIERRYTGCADDTAGAGSPKTGDLCWQADNASYSLGAGGGELVRDDATGQWRPRRDDGSRVERLVGAGNGDNDGEYWQLTTTDGTRYVFGRRPDSAWTAPVFGNHPGEPCHAATFAASWCQQTWRWNLDTVIDTHGNTMTYHYGTETNHYGRNLTASAGTAYTRGGWLARIDYGTRQDTSAPAPARVVFDVADRCRPTGPCDGQPAQLPDVPLDRACAAGTACTGRLSPTFWTRQRLAKVTTEVRSGDGYRPVDSWTLAHTFPDPGDGTAPSMWLNAVRHTGHVGGNQAVPEVNFDAVHLPNRVDALEGVPPLNRPRIAAVHNESGGVLGVSYSPPQCRRAGAMPTAPDRNTMRCFPAHWMPDGATAPVLDWFHKHVVTQVVETDRTGGSPNEVTTYEYLDGAAWHYDDNDLTPQHLRTWGQWRGYGRVRTLHGEPAPGVVRSVTEHRYLRGMDDDRLASGGRRDVWVADTDGGSVEDHSALAGFLREEIEYDGDGGPVVTATVHHPWRRGPTATRNRGGVTVEAFDVEVGRTQVRTALAAGGWRRTEVGTEFDGYGQVSRIDDRGDLSTPDDDECTRFSYARNPHSWLVELTSRVETVAVPCAQAPRYPDDLVSDVRSYHDDADEHGAVPTRGDVTRVEEVSGHSGGTPTYAVTTRRRYDAQGRVTEAHDAAGRRTVTTYQADGGGPVTATTTANTLGHTTTTELEPAWGVATAEIDANGRRTDLAYDPLGRLTAAWLPGRSRAAGHTPTTEYRYLVRTDGPVVVTTRSLAPDGGHIDSHDLYDGHLRLRQTQAPAPGGGRLVTDTSYDSRGLPVRENDTYHHTAPPDTTLRVAADNTVPAQTRTVYDGAERPVAEIFLVLGVERWRTTTAYGGDRESVAPPSGAVATTELTDADGRVVELRQHHGASPDSDYDATLYHYHRNGALERVTDADGNTWRYHYDLRGQLVRTEDPDRGTSTFTYDQGGDLASVTDARNQKLTPVYDPLGRVVRVHHGGTDGPKLLEYGYDTLAKGHLGTATRYVGADAYTTSVTGLDEAYRPTGTAVDVPAAAAGRLAGRYEFTATYHADGSLATTGTPAVGGLPAETVQHAYDPLGLPTRTFSTLATYVAETTYNGYAEPQRLTLGATGKRMWHTYYRQEGTRRLERRITDRELASSPRVADVQHTYDDAGNLLRIADTPRGGPADIQCFRYDHLRRMTDAWTTPDPCGQPAYHGAGPAPYHHSYTYDRSGNRLTETRHGAGEPTRASYRYPAAGDPQPHAVSWVETTTATVTRRDSYRYDATGNLVERLVDGNTQRLTWDPEGRLGAVTGGGGTTSYVYDADGNRLLRHDPTGSTLYLGTMEVHADRDGGAITATRYYGHDGETVAVRTSQDGLVWLGGDHHGTHQTAVSADTLTVRQRRFLPFGEQRGPDTAWSGEKGFVGGTVDRSTGLVHLGAREYDPGTGRFVSVDPIIDPGDPQQMNGYAYGNNAPATFSDPDGLKPCSSSGCRSGGGKGPSAKDLAWAKKVKKQSVVRVAINAGGKILSEFLGINDIKRCFGKGKVSSCLSLALDLIPWGKILKAKKLASAVKRAWDGVQAWRKNVKRADRILDSHRRAQKASKSRKASEAVPRRAEQSPKATKSKSAPKREKASPTREKPAGSSARKGGSGGGTRSGSSCKVRHSFHPDTKVVMGDGRRTAIRDIKPGDTVLATEPRTGRTDRRQVTATHRNLDRDLVDVSVRTGNRTSTVRTTAHHPFWNSTRGEWTDAGQLAPGDRLRSSGSGSARVTVEAVGGRAGEALMRDLTVADIHTYYVVAGGTPVLVHNCGEAFLDNAGEVYVRKNHTAGGAGTDETKGLFNKDEDLYKLADDSSNFHATPQANGRCARVCDAGRSIGTDVETGLPTSTYTVITDKYGGVITMHPGVPR
ncbi:polymorphic toxin-type HINT domain-containing protein [Micromonospora sp. LOL_025]|uniref:polymorphic toxin-type HINT domain-containing protein n=1 Tax=Micromonospora sp. LOL_025 TaxID=3345413 RepID=UPI003A83FA28